MNIEFNWKRRAIIILAGSFAFLSIALATLPIRDAERGRLLAERAIEEE
jgi:hypothetical protein